MKLDRITRRRLTRKTLAEDTRTARGRGTDRDGEVYYYLSVRNDTHEYQLKFSPQDWREICESFNRFEGR